MAKPVILPMFNMDMTEGLLVRWMVAEGETVREGDPLCEIETDKVNMEVESPGDGVLAGRRYAEGDAIPVTSVIAYIAADAAEAATLASVVPASVASAPAPVESAAAAPASAPAPAAVPEPAPAAQAATPAVAAPAVPAAAAPTAAAEPADPYLTGGRRRATPAVRRIAREHGIPLADVSDAQGRVTMAALKAAIDAQAAAPASAPATVLATPPAVRAAVTASGVARPLEGTRRRIAERMTIAHEAPHITLVREVQVPELMRIRKALAPTAPSVTALIAAATVRALLAHPEVNSTFERGEVTVHPGVNLGIAVARPDGLIVPVIRGAERLSVLAISDELKRISEAARTNRLTMADITGGTFTITSLGQVGIDWFTPLINPPQVAILGVGRVVDRVVPIPSGIGVVPTVYLSLTCDHRVVDGAPGAEFLATLAGELESPGWLWAGGAGG